MMSVSLNTPILLTLSRLILSPLVVPLLFSLLMPLNSFTVDVLLSLVFLSLSLTDFFDGFLARRYQQVTLMGALLDPIADKFLLFSTLITLVYLKKIFFYWAIIFIAREFFIMGLRYMALTQGFKMPVSFTAKLKTVFQIVYIMFLIINPNATFFADKNISNFIELSLLLISCGLSIYSALKYYTFFINHMRSVNEV